MLISMSLYEKIRSEIGKGISTVMLGAAFIVSGCGPLERPEKGFYPTRNIEITMESIDYKVKKVGKKIQTTSAHKDDRWLFSGATTTDVGGEIDSASVGIGGSLGLGYKVGWLDMRVNAGLNVRHNSVEDEGYHVGLYDWKQQENDYRHPWQGAFVFTQINPGSYTLTPKVGAEITLFEKLMVGCDVGFPYMEWEAKSGHDRYSCWETVQHETWRDFGSRLSGKVGWKFTDEEVETLLFVRVFKESYAPEFAGEKAEIEATGWGAGIQFSF